VARSSHGSRHAIPWATAQKPRPSPRVVRLGRAANDNGNAPALRWYAIVISVLLALAVLAVIEGLF